MMKEFNHYCIIYIVHFALLILSAPPLFICLEQYAFIPFGILFAITMYWARKVEKIKKINDVQTNKENGTFTEGKKVDEIKKMIEEGNRPYQNIINVVICAVVTVAACLLFGLLIHLFLN